MTTSDSVSASVRSCSISPAKGLRRVDEGEVTHKCNEVL